MKKTIKKCPRVLAIVVVSLISFIPFYYTLTMSTHSTDEIMLGVSAIPGKYLLRKHSRQGRERGERCRRSKRLSARFFCSG